VRRQHSIFISGLTLAGLALSRQVKAQACCAGSATITPARVGPHDVGLVGVQAQAANAYGSYASNGDYRGSPAGASEFDFEQDVLAAYKPFENLQFSLLVPLVETRRTTPGTSEFGGGLGDVNAGVRYDLVRAQRYRFVPGIAVLGGLTLPTGRPPDSARKPLATDATGIGSVQGVVGLALEQLEGPWIFNLTGLLAKRAPRSAYGVRETLGTQYVGIAAVGYAFDNGFASAVLASYTTETDATLDGQEAPGSSRRTVAFRILGLAPLIQSELFLQGGWFVNPPFDGWGKNGIAAYGFALALVRTWS
jgi:hypothetical protein